MIGTTVSHYRILEKLGEGGMGEVYLAQDLQLKRRVALKALSREIATHPDMLKRFTGEARMVAALNHPNIVTIYSVEEDQGHLFVTMEYVEGKTLADLIPKAGFPLMKFLDLAVPIADALRAAHEEGITHRDLSPTNIMVSNSGRVKVLDFGLAKRGDLPTHIEPSTLPTASLPLSGQIVGTVPYMSPEQIQGKTVGACSDIFSLGIILYEMVTGRYPFDGQTIPEVISSILRDTPGLVNHLKIGIPFQLGQIIQHCIEKNPERRYQASLDLRNELKNLRREVRSGEAQAQETSIAVLPFTDMSALKDQQYFCDGIAEELINALVTIKDLKVAARTSAFSFKGKNLDIREIGKTLNVATILEGSVRKSGNRIRITAQLVNVADGYDLWSEKYDREMDDVFVLQDEIARKIADQLRSKLVGKMVAPLVRRHTENPVAYNLYLKGRYHWNRRTEGAIKKGIDYFKEAVNADPNYSLAFSGLADCYTQLGDYGYLPPAEARSEAKKASSRALDVDDTIAEAHASRAYPTLLYDWDWPAAEREFKRAIELNPDYATAHQLYAEFLTAMGRMEEAIQEIERAQNLEPLSLIVNTVVGWVFYRARRFVPAMEHCLKTLELNPDFALAHHLLGWVYDLESRYEEAVAEARKAVRLSGQSTLMTGSLGYACATSGKIEEAEKILDGLKKRSLNAYVPPYDIALVYLGLGQKDEALAWLEKAYEERYGWLVYLKADPIWDGLRSEPGYKSLVKRIGLP